MFNHFGLFLKHSFCERTVKKHLFFLYFSCLHNHHTCRWQDYGPQKQKTKIFLSFQFQNEVEFFRIKVEFPCFHLFSFSCWELGSSIIHQVYSPDFNWFVSTLFKNYFLLHFGISSFWTLTRSQNLDSFFTSTFFIKFWISSQKFKLKTKKDK